MKTLKLLIITTLLILLSSCIFQKEYYVILQVVEDDDTYLSDKCMVTSVGSTFQCKYELVPECNNTIDVTLIESLDPDVISVDTIDADNNAFYCTAKKAGKTKVKVYTESYHTSTSLPIYVH